MITSTTSKLLKLTSPSTTSSYYLKDRKEVWDYDPLDKTSPEGPTVLIGYGGKRYKLAGGLTVVEPPIIEPPEPPTSWFKIGAEHDTITVPDNTNVRYGDLVKYVEKNVSGTFKAENEFFGSDPLPGLQKFVYADKEALPNPTPTPEPTPTTGTIPNTDIIVPTIIVPTSMVEINAATRYGLVNGGDNTTQLLKIRTEWTGKSVKIVIPDGWNLRYTNPDFLAGIRELEFIANGCTFQNITAVADDMFKCPLRNNGILIVGGKGASGQKIKTARKGDTSITLIDAASYSVGDRIFIAGYEEQFYGYPPNPRFFEWNKVKSVSGSVITLETPLKWAYNELWRDVAGMMPYSIDTNFGKPRVFKLSDYTYYAHFVGGNYLRNPNTNAGVTSAFRYIADTLIVDGVTSEDFWPSENHISIYKKCKSQIFEVDKMNGYVELNECYVDGPRSAVTGATGADVLVLKNNIFKNYSGVSPRVLYAEGNTFESKTGDPGLYPHPEMTWVEKVYLKNNTFKGGDPSYTSTMYKWTAGSFTSLAATSNSITFAGTNTQAAKQMGPGPIQSTDGATALLKDIIWDGSNFVAQLENVTGTLKAGQVWMFNREQKVIDLGGNVDLGGKKIY
jgi:hypothetical protein